MLFDFLGLSGSLEEQANEFLNKLRQNQQWSQESIMKFLDFHKERVRCKELAAGTLKNYYRAAKLFCEMNDLTLNWKRIVRGLPRAKNSSNDRSPTIEEIRKLTPKHIEGPVMIEIDHAFDVKGAGTVVLGMIKQGTVKVHDLL